MSEVIKLSTWSRTRCPMWRINIEGTIYEGRYNQAEDAAAGALRADRFRRQKAKRWGGFTNVAIVIERVGGDE